MLQIEYFCSVSIGEEELALLSEERTRRHQFSFLSVYTAWRGDSSRTQISPWGMERWQRCMPRPVLLSGPRKDKDWKQLTEKIGHFLHGYTSHLQIDASSEIDRRRSNECASGAQRHATRLLLDLGSGASWLVWFLKHRGPAVYVIQI